MFGGYFSAFFFILLNKSHIIPLCITPIIRRDVACYVSGLQPNVSLRRCTQRLYIRWDSCSVSIQTDPNGGESRWFKRVQTPLGSGTCIYGNDLQLSVETIHSFVWERHTAPCGSHPQPNVAMVHSLVWRQSTASCGSDPPN